MERLADLAGQSPSIAIAIAVALGMLSTSMCPFTVPAGIGIIGYVGSRDDEVVRSRLRNVAVALSFYAAVLLSFALLGVVASYIGALFLRWEAAFALFSAIVALIAGLVVILRPQMSQRLPTPQSPRLGIGGAFLFGAIYSGAIVSTSTGPLLLLLAGAAAVGRPMFGGLLSIAYAVGRGFPFVLLGIFGDAIVRWVGRFARFARAAELIIGIGLIALAIYMGWTAIRLN